MKRVCAWCKKILDPGKDGDMITHGQCEVCQNIMIKELKEMEKKNEK